LRSFAKQTLGHFTLDLIPSLLLWHLRGRGLLLRRFILLLWQTLRGLFVLQQLHHSLLVEELRILDYSLDLHFFPHSLRLQHLFLLQLNHGFFVLLVSVLVRKSFDFLESLLRNHLLLVHVDPELALAFVVIFEQKHASLLIGVSVHVADDLLELHHSGFPPDLVGLVEDEDVGPHLLLRVVQDLVAEFGDFLFHPVGEVESVKLLCIFDLLQILQVALLLIRVRRRLFLLRLHHLTRLGFLYFVLSIFQGLFHHLQILLFITDQRLLPFSLQHFGLDLLDTELLLNFNREVIVEAIEDLVLADVLLETLDGADGIGLLLPEGVFLGGLVLVHLEVLGIEFVEQTYVGLVSGLHQLDRWLSRVDSTPL
jgi:hypothetical protein